MGGRTRFKCINCGFRLVNYDSFFYYDDELSQTIDYHPTMMNAGRFRGHGINGRVSESYCGNCKKFVRVLSIRDFEGCENPSEIVKRGIKNNLDALLEEIQELIEIKKREKFTVGKDSDSYIIDFTEYDHKYYKYFEPVNITEAFTNAAKKYGLELICDSGYEPPVFENVDDAIISAKKDFHEDIDSYINALTSRYERYSDSIYLIIEETDKPIYEYHSSQKVTCPDCGKKIYKILDYESTCPNCDFPLISHSTEID